MLPLGSLGHEAGSLLGQTMMSGVDALRLRKLARWASSVARTRRSFFTSVRLYLPESVTWNAADGDQVSLA